MIGIVGAFSMEVAVLVSDVRKMVINPRPDVAWINAAQYEAYQLGRQPHNSRVSVPASLHIRHQAEVR